MKFVNGWASRVKPQSSRSVEGRIGAFVAALHAPKTVSFVEGLINPSGEHNLQAVASVKTPKSFTSAMVQVTHWAKGLECVESRESYPAC